MGVIVDVIQFIPREAVIRPWADAVVDARGHDPRSLYVERFWLSVIGPTATWIVRRLAECFDAEPDGFVLDLEHTASTMGLSFAKGAASPFGKALHRCVMFGVAQPMADGFAVRRRFPSVPQRHLRRLPDDLQLEHQEWTHRGAGADTRDLEQRLIDAGVPPVAAVRASEFAAWAA
jgi:hypothetical protein